MSNYVLISDSTTDISAQMINELELLIVPLTYTMGGMTYHNIPDAGEIDNKTFYTKLREGIMATTSQVNSEDFISVFEPILESGNDILYIGFSSGLSGTFQSSVIAKKELEVKYPQRKIMVVDSLAASMGEGLLVYHAANMRKEGADIDEVYQWVIDNRNKTCHFFTVDDLNHLKRGGRVSSASAFVGTMLGIKPILHVDDEGHLIPVAKVRGRKQSLEMLVKYMDDLAVNPANQTVFISHGDALEDAKYVEKEIKKRFGTKKIYINYIGPVVGAHSGPGTISLFFMGKSKI